MLRQYYAASPKRPFQHIAKVAPDDIKATKKIDSPKLGVISGHVFDGKEIYYGMCKKADKLYCFDVYYSANEQTNTIRWSSGSQNRSKNVPIPVNVFKKGA